MTMIVYSKITLRKSAQTLKKVADDFTEKNLNGHTILWWKIIEYLRLDGINKKIPMRISCVPHMRLPFSDGINNEITRQGYKIEKVFSFIDLETMVLDLYILTNIVIYYY